MTRTERSTHASRGLQWSKPCDQTLGTFAGVDDRGARFYSNSIRRWWSESPHWWLNDDGPEVDLWLEPTTSQPSHPIRSDDPFGCDCSATVDYLDRPVGSGIVFTRNQSEWLGSAETYDTPVLVIGVTHYEGLFRQHAQQHAGLEVVGWLQEFFGVSQATAIRLAGVSQATYYLWKKNSATFVRPATIAEAVRLRATLVVLLKRFDREEARSILVSGSPSLLDQLLGVETRASAIEGITALAEPQPARPLPRMTDSAEIVGELARMTAEQEGEGGYPRAGAQRLTDQEMRTLDAND